MSSTPASESPRRFGVTSRLGAPWRCCRCAPRTVAQATWRWNGYRDRCTAGRGASRSCTWGRWQARPSGPDGRSSRAQEPEISPGYLVRAGSRSRTTARTSSTSITSFPDSGRLVACPRAMMEPDLQLTTEWEEGTDMTDSLRAETVRLTGHGGDEIEAYLAQPLDEGRFGQRRGDPPHARLRRGNEGDHDGSSRRTAIWPFARTSTAGRRRERLRTTPRLSSGRSEECPTIGSSATFKALPAFSRRSGPRTAALPRSATAQAAGSRSWPPAAFRSTPRWTAMAPSSSAPRLKGVRSRIGPIVHLTKDLSCPLLGLFGAEDQYPSPAARCRAGGGLETGRQELMSSTPTRGPATPSSATDRPSYRPEAAKDGWQRIWEFFGRYLAS